MLVAWQKVVNHDAEVDCVLDNIADIIDVADVVFQSQSLHLLDLNTDLVSP